MTPGSSGRPVTLGSRILIVSKDPQLREHLYDLLTAHGYQVKTVASGKVGTETMVHEQPDLIIIDSSANDCQGWSFPDWVRRFNEQVPIIALGRPGEDAPDPRTASDIQAYLREFSDTAVLDSVTRWIVQSRSNAPIDYISFPGTILAIDDERAYLQALEEFLQPRRCTVVTASSGEEGLTMLKQHEPTLVLLDLKMPGMDGLVALKKIKELQPKLPVVMMTAVEERHLVAQAFALGALEYVVKPYDLKSLKAILSYLKTTGKRPDLTG